MNVSDKLIEDVVAKQDVLCEKCKALSADELLCDGTRIFINKESSAFYGYLDTYYALCDKVAPQYNRGKIFNLVMASGIPEKYVAKYIDEEDDGSSLDWVTNNQAFSETDRENIFSLGVLYHKRNMRYFHIFFPVFAARGFDWNELFTKYVGCELVVFDRADLVNLDDKTVSLLREYLSLRDDQGFVTWFIVNNDLLETKAGPLGDLLRKRVVWN